MKITPNHKTRTRYFIDEYRRGLELTSNNAKVSVHWASDYLDKQALRAWFMSGLHRKINWNGGIKLEYRDDSIDLWRDRQIYTAWVQRRQKTQWGIRFHTKYFRKRFPAIEVEMQEHFEDRF